MFPLSFFHSNETNISYVRRLKSGILRNSIRNSTLDPFALEELRYSERLGNLIKEINSVIVILHIRNNAENSQKSSWWTQDKIPNY